MQYADKLQQEITRIARLFGLDLRAGGAAYYLKKSHVYSLTILVRAERQIAVIYRGSSGNMASMEIFVSTYGWVPLSRRVIRQDPVISAEDDSSKAGFKGHEDKRYGCLADICNAAAKEIRSRHFEDRKVELTIAMSGKIVS